METLLISLIDELKLLSDGFNGHSKSKQTELRRNLLCNCLVIKGHGEDSLECGIIPPNVSKEAIINEWRKACERIYKHCARSYRCKGLELMLPMSSRTLDAMAILPTVKRMNDQLGFPRQSKGLNVQVLVLTRTFC